MLEYSNVASYTWLGDFDLLRHSQSDVMDRPWASCANCEVVVKHYKVLCAREEITRLNVESCHLQRWIDDEDKHLFATVKVLQETNKLLAYAVSVYAQARHRVNNVHHH